MFSVEETAGAEAQRGVRGAVGYQGICVLVGQMRRGRRQGRGADIKGLLNAERRSEPLSGCVGATEEV